ncbi:MAG: hypothetical protein KatS3mg121_0692 [Gammaproteobacteria bacterium]|nr:MAG: hypothetical protein KatS3mg121_0692 [Gammaproteobacteria bacterium]
MLWRPPRPDVERYYAALDMAVHPACFEAFGLTVVEMMACGVPVWLPRTVGAAELLPAAAQAGLPARAEPARLAADLAAWLADPELRARWRAWGLAAVAPCRLAAHREAFFGYCRRAGLVLPPG